MANPYKYERFIAAHPTVEIWLRNRPEETRRNFATHLQRFCEAMKITPGEWQSQDKFEARDLAWKYVEPKIVDHSTVAKSDLTALKSFYRNKNGERLPFDGGRGGKHYLRVKYKKRAIEHIPGKAEMYQIIDMASSLRDKAILLVLFQSGVRVNVIEHLTYGDIQDQLDKDVITLKITGELDYKLRGSEIDYYFTFVNGEGVETLRRYCEIAHRNSERSTPLFMTRGKRAITQRQIWRVVKTCIRRAGLDSAKTWTHSIRKAFRKIVRQTNIDDDDKEQLMGHVISGSRAAYYDKKDVPLLLKAYQHCNFQREIPQSETYKLREQLEMERVERGSLEKRIDALERLLKQYVNGKD